MQDTNPTIGAIASSFTRHHKDFVVENGRGIGKAAVICGGTAGCVIARRLAEDPNVSVLILEAGRPKEDVPASGIPAAVSQILDTEADWKIQSEPCAELNDRQLHLGREKFVGGSSGCNGTLCIRGVGQDYDDWGVEDGVARRWSPI
ncbi:Nn.00g074350.m01.CDS01 [Neocucurbitaria sp. VM-36]